MTGANRIHKATDSSPKWGKHKHRRFINGVDPHFPAPELPAEEGPATATAAALPWNLRNRNNGGAKGKTEEEEEERSRPLEKKSKRLQSKMAKKEAARKLEVALSKSEIEDDFLKMLAKKPPSRPKKRPTALQKRLDVLFPGLCLPKIPAGDIYDVPKSPSLRKVIGVIKS